MQRVFITGASSGIGAALVRHYAACDACVALVGRRLPQLQALAASLPNPAQHRIYAIDVTDHAALAAAARDFMAVYDGIDVVIANAGISQGTLTQHVEDLDVFERIIATNLNAMVATFAPFITAMKDQRRGRPPQHPMRLVGIASVAGIRGLPGASAYSASKAAVISYCESLRVELRSSGIKVVTIVPGYIDTPMTQVNRYRMPFLMPVERFAAAAVGAIDAGRSYRVIPWQMGMVGKLLRCLPNPIYDWAFSKAPHKARAPAASEAP
ncbi:MAG: SDR family oxidoreductase [Herminiimonas sp.]|nr:SDR family oxidoreductase [Herminiimonas sp.]